MAAGCAAKLATVWRTIICTEEDSSYQLDVHSSAAQKITSQQKSGCLLHAKVVHQEVGAWHAFILSSRPRSESAGAVRMVRNASHNLGRCCDIVAAP